MDTRSNGGSLFKDVFDNVIDAAHPNVAKINNDMSDLYKAEDSLRSGANAEGTEAQKKANNPPSLWQKIEQHPAAAITSGVLGGGTIAAFGKDILNNAAGLGATAISDISKLPDTIANKFGYTRTPVGEQNKTGNENDQFHIDSVSQDASTGHYTLPENPGIKPFVPGTPSYTQASNALSGGGRVFMQNAPQYLNSINTIQDDVKSGMPLDILHSFKTAQDWQSYLSNPSSPYAKQVSDVGRLNSQFRAAYSAINNGTNPDDSQLLAPGDSAEQFIEKYKAMVSFINDSYKQFQTPYLQTSEAPNTPNNNGGAVNYNGSLPATPPAFPSNSLPSDMLQSPLQALPIQ